MTLLAHEWIRPPTPVTMTHGLIYMQSAGGGVPTHNSHSLTSAWFPFWSRVDHEHIRVHMDVPCVIAPSVLVKQVDQLHTHRMTDLVSNVVAHSIIRPFVYPMPVASRTCQVPVSHGDIVSSRCLSYRVTSYVATVPYVDTRSTSCTTPVL